MKYKHTVGDKSALIEITETEKIPQLTHLDTHKYIRDKNCEYFILRTMVTERLAKSAASLPPGYQFKIFETYRSMEKQIQFWNKEISKVKKQHPDWTQEQLEEKANEGIANPYTIGSGHQTGAALDLTICKNGKELDMGTGYLDTSNPKTPTFATGLTQKQRENRKLLYSLMALAGLVNYPLEWWHYSHGEHEWAVITNQPKTKFARIDNLMLKIER